MRHVLQRHHIPIKATFAHSVVLTYALPQNHLLPLLPAGLTLDTYEDYGFVAIALVQTRSLRPAFLPEVVGQDFFLSGYRIFTRYKSQSGRSLRGLRILRSDTDRRFMAFFGNLLTHYNYRVADVTVQEKNDHLEFRIKTPKADADLQVRVYPSEIQETPPKGSPFPDLNTARKYAGPLPFTFDYERQTHSIICIEGKRTNWKPSPIRVEVAECTFFNSPPFAGLTPILANAFYINNIAYKWLRGVREELPKAIP
jgi:hypothetical protein